MTLFEKEADTDAMKAYIDFIARFKKTHSSRQDTANRYKIFKSNYEMINKHNLNADMLPFEMELNYYADMTADEFLHHHRLRVPKHLLAESVEVSQRVHSRGHHNSVAMFDAKDESLPKAKNWYEEGMVTAPYDQH